MRTKTRTATALVLAIIIAFTFVITGCGPKATFKHPDDAVERFLNGEEIVGLTIVVHTNPDKDVAEFSSKLGVIYDEGYHGSFTKTVVIFVGENDSFGANETHVVKINSVRETRTGYIYIYAVIVE